ncbi:tetraacyldisaccharide 4'-kinase [Thiohalocapsa halophila]|uniref:UPF0434 protein CKO31_19395 n=1 Tax=Thiohalocapsa halophila TaxID=69359 RepID=A0ABS1CLY7_9GAMM|nr:Trm112 family protein [Thiohalocapsa halophila]MBK1632873.1 tetraacyldisaccharide 4'-kinase [Thiohalocapsa halophila]
MLNKKLLDILVCPVTKGPLVYDREAQELISVAARLAYPIVDDIPDLIESDARTVSEAEAERIRKSQTPR